MVSRQKISITIVAIAMFLVALSSPSLAQLKRWGPQSFIGQVDAIAKKTLGNHLINVELRSNTFRLKYLVKDNVKFVDANIDTGEVVYNGKVIGVVKVVAVPEPPPPPPALSDSELDVCPIFNLIETWQYSYETSRRAWPQKYLRTLEKEYDPLFAKANSSDMRSLGVSYRNCLRIAAQRIQRDDNYVITSQQNVDCSSCKIHFSNLALHLPRLKIQEGLTYLLSTNLAEQDWTEAATKMREGIVLMTTVHDDFVTQANAAYEAKGEYAQKIARSSSWGTMLGALAGGVITKNMTVAMDYSNRKLEEIGQTRAQALSDVAARQRELFDIPPANSWSDDGVRVTVPIIQPNALTGQGTGNYLVYAPLGSIRSQFHLTQIVKVFTAFSGSCTGSFVGKRLILTNRHCVFNDAGQFGLPRKANYFYYKNQSEGLTQNRETYWIKNAIYPEASHLLNKANDWALLETTTPSTTGYLGAKDPSSISSTADLRVAVAGYSGDLNEGTEITMDWGCQAKVRDGIIEHMCRTWRGASGSPIIAINKANLRNIVIGVHASGPVGRATSGKRSGSASPALFKAIADTRVRQAQEDQLER